jgi:hypothetical protein
MYDIAVRVVLYNDGSGAEVHAFAGQPEVCEWSARFRGDAATALLAAMDAAEGRDPVRALDRIAAEMRGYGRDSGDFGEILDTVARIVRGTWREVATEG